MKLQLKVKSYHPAYLNQFCKSLFENSVVFSLVKLPQKKEHFTVLRSPHVDKKARDQFERITYNRLLNLEINDETKFSKIINQIHKNTIGVQVELKINKYV